MRSLSILFIFAVLCSAKVEERQSSCTISTSTAVNLPLDGTPVNGFVNGTDTCFFFTFTASANLNADVLFTISSGDSFLIASLVNSEDTNPNTNSDFSLSTYTTDSNFNYIAGVTRIPAFALAGKTWFLRAYTYLTSSSISFSVNATQVTPATAAIPINGKTTIVTSLSEYAPIFWEVIIPQPNKAYQITLSNLKTTGTDYFTLYSAVNEYPIGGNSISTGSTQQTFTFRTTAPGDRVYISADTYGSNTSATFDVDVSQVVCGPAVGLTACASFVNYNTPTVTQSDLDNESLITLVIVLGGCNTEAVSVICGSLFPKCDANGYGIPPCGTDCETILTGCPKLTSSNTSTCLPPAGVETYCYAQTGAGSTLSTSIIAVLLVVLLVISM